MDHSLQTISYIADIGSLVVLMARRKLPRRSEVAEEKRLYKMICHVFHSADVRQHASPVGGQGGAGVLGSLPPGLGALWLCAGVS